MSSIKVTSLDEDLPFGARIWGVTHEALSDEEDRQQIRDVFSDRGMIVFEEVERTSEMQLAISNVFGPLKEHPVKSVSRVDQDRMPGVIELKAGPHMAVVEIDGVALATWQPWHFDHCYNDELNLAGVLRAVTPSYEDGRTAFADGVQMYDALPAEIREQIEGQNIVYTLDLLFDHMRFGKPGNFRELQKQPDTILEIARTMPRAIHPAVWTRESGEKVLHVSPWMAVGIEDHENPTGDALLDAVWEAMEAVMRPYIHQWNGSEMIIWDNTRMLHKACGCDPTVDRVMHRTTIKGDYGYGSFETAPTGPVVLDVM